MEKERQFKVKVIQISLKNNGIANYGSVVSESQLAAPVHELINGGYIDIYNGDDIVDFEEVSENKSNDLESAIPGAKKANSKK